MKFFKLKPKYLLIILLSSLIFQANISYGGLYELIAKMVSLARHSRKTDRSIAWLYEKDGGLEPSFRAGKLYEQLGDYLSAWRVWRRVIENGTNELVSAVIEHHNRMLGNISQRSLPPINLLEKKEAYGNIARVYRNLANETTDADHQRVLKLTALKAKVEKHRIIAQLATTNAEKAQAYHSEFLAQHSMMELLPVDSTEWAQVYAAGARALNKEMQIHCIEASEHHSRAESLLVDSPDWKREKKEAYAAEAWALGRAVLASRSEASAYSRLRTLLPIDSTEWAQAYAAEARVRVGRILESWAEAEKYRAWGILFDETSQERETAYYKEQSSYLGAEYEYDVVAELHSKVGQTYHERAALYRSKAESSPANSPEQKEAYDAEALRHSRAVQAYNAKVKTHYDKIGLMRARLKEVTISPDTKREERRLRYLGNLEKKEYVKAALAHNQEGRAYLAEADARRAGADANALERAARAYSKAANAFQASATLLNRNRIKEQLPEIVETYALEANARELEASLHSAKAARLPPDSPGQAEIHAAEALAYFKAFQARSAQAEAHHLAWPSVRLFSVDSPEQAKERKAMVNTLKKENVEHVTAGRYDLATEALIHIIKISREAYREEPQAHIHAGLLNLAIDALVRAANASQKAGNHLDALGAMKHAVEIHVDSGDFITAATLAKGLESIYYPSLRRRAYYSYMGQLYEGAASQASSTEMRIEMLSQAIIAHTQAGNDKSVTRVNARLNPPKETAEEKPPTYDTQATELPKFPELIFNHPNGDSDTEHQEFELEGE